MEKAGEAVRNVAAVLGIIGTLSGWGYAAWNWGRLTLALSPIHRPQLLQATVTYHRETEEQKETWQRVWDQMFPVCVRSDSSCPLTEIPQQLPRDAQGEIVLLPKYDSATDKYTFHGYGFYRETLKDGNLTSAPLFWVVELSSSEGRTVAQLDAGTEIDLTVYQQGQGNRIPFRLAMSTERGGTFSSDAPVYYDGVRIATVQSLQDSKQYSLGATR